MNPVDGLDPVKRQVLSEIVADALSSLILSGELTPGERLPTEQGLADRFGVSRNVIREALRRLNEQGLAEVRHGAGVYVCAPDQETVVGAFARYVHLNYGKEQVRSIYETRALLEPQIAALAAERATAAEIAALDETFERMQRNTGNPKAWAQADLDFHLVMEAARGQEGRPRIPRAGAGEVSSQCVGAHPCGRQAGRRKAIPLPRIIERIPGERQGTRCCGCTQIHGRTT